VAPGCPLRLLSGPQVTGANPTVDDGLRPAGEVGRLAAVSDQRAGGARLQMAMDHWSRATEQADDGRADWRRPWRRRSPMWRVSAASCYARTSISRVAAC